MRLPFCMAQHWMIASSVWNLIGGITLLDVTDEERVGVKSAMKNAWITMRVVADMAERPCTILCRTQVRKRLRWRTQVNALLLFCRDIFICFPVKLSWFLEKLMSYAFL